MQQYYECDAEGAELRVCSNRGVMTTTNVIIIIIITIIIIIIITMVIIIIITMIAFLPEDQS